MQCPNARVDILEVQAQTLNSTAGLPAAARRPHLESQKETLEPHTLALQAGLASRSLEEVAEVETLLLKMVNRAVLLDAERGARILVRFQHVNP